MPKALNLTGQIFGNLKVLSKAESKSGHTYWNCECLLCGNKKAIQTNHLTSGATQTCGCKMFQPRNLSLNRNCILCGKEFSSNNFQRKYCFDCSPSGMDSAERQRRIKRSLKHQLIVYKGGKCQICGYDKCEGALHFHHRDPKEKEFTLSQVNLNDTNFSIKKMYQEVDKCDLLCANCHYEQHYLED